MKSLLEILIAEDRVVGEINSAESSIALFQERREEIAAIPYNCKTKKEDMASCDRLIAEYQSRKDKNMIQLKAVREDLRLYLAAL